jgi:flagellin
MQRLSTGLRINNAKDDAAGLAISNRMTSDIRGFGVAIRNANDGLSMAQTADGALGQVTDMLQRMRELAVQAGNGSLNADNRIASQLEVDQLKQQIDNIATQTNFNSINLLDGSAGNIKLQTNVRANQQMTMSIDSAQTKDIGLGVRSSLTATGFTGTETIVPEKQEIVISGTATSTTGTIFLGVSIGTALATTTTSTAQAVVDAKASILAGTQAQALGLTDISYTGSTLTLTYGGQYGKGDIGLTTASVTNGVTFAASTETVKGSVTGITKNMAAGDMFINSVQVGASQAASDSVSFSDKASSAISKVAAINSVSGDTGVTASLGNTQVAGSAMVVGTASGTLVINGVSTATIATVSDAGLDRAAVVTAVNNISAQTGVRAVDTGDINKGVILVADDARNITLQYGVNGSLSSLNTGLSGFAVSLASMANISSSTGATTVAANDKLTINGVLAYTAVAADTVGTIVTAVNTKTSQTGVTASIVGSVSAWGIQLSSTSGNVNVTSAADLQKFSISNAYRSVNVAQTSTGTYQLGSSTNGPITVSSSSNGDLSTAGLTAGTFSANTSVATTTDRNVATAAPSTTTTGLLQAGTLRINGSSIVASTTADDTSSAAYVSGTSTAITSSTKGASAISIAAAINKSTSSTGVTATAAPNIVKGTTFNNTTIGLSTVQAGSLFVNGVTIALSSLTAGYTRGDVASLVNAQQGTTGVVATDNGRGLTLTANDGRNISLGLTSSLSAESVGISAGSIGLTSTSAASSVATTAALSATTYSRVTLSSDKTFTVEGGSDGNANFALLGFKTGTFGGVDNGVKVSKIDISTQAGAQVAITSLDAALKSVSLNQARLGAFQNRLDQVVSNLTTMNQNMSASRSRVQDADYATETTNLAKSQIISQAATAMLAQANQSSQSVLALLK